MKFIYNETIRGSERLIYGNSIEALLDLQ